MPKKIVLMFSEVIQPDAAKRIRESLESFVKNPTNSISLWGDIQGDVKGLIIDSDDWSVDIVTGHPKPEPKRPAKKKETPA